MICYCESFHTSITTIKTLSIIFQFTVNEPIKYTVCLPLIVGYVLLHFGQTGFSFAKSSESRTNSTSYFTLSDLNYNNLITGYLYNLNKQKPKQNLRKRRYWWSTTQSCSIYNSHEEKTEDAILANFEGLITSALITTSLDYTKVCNVNPNCNKNTKQKSV